MEKTLAIELAERTMIMVETADRLRLAMNSGSAEDQTLAVVEFYRVAVEECHWCKKHASQLTDVYAALVEQCGQNLDKSAILRNRKDFTRGLEIAFPGKFKGSYFDLSLKG